MKRNPAFSARCIGAAALIGVLSLAGCDSPVGPGVTRGGDTTPPTTTPPTLSELFRAIPTLDTLLPRSLQAGEGGQPLTSRLFRSMGNVSELNPDTLPIVTAQGYLDLRESISGNEIDMFLGLLEIGIAGRDIPLETDFPLGVFTIWEDTSMDLGVINVSREEPSGDYEIKWSFLRKEGDLEIPYWIYFGFTNAASVDAMKVTMAATAGDEVKMFLFVAEYDAAVREMRTIYVVGENFSKKSITWQGDIVKFADLRNDHKLVAWANDRMGGVVGQDIWGGNNYIWTEFYNGSGDLVKNQWGQGAYPVQWNSLFTQGSPVNVQQLLGGTKPDRVYRRVTQSEDEGAPVVVAWSSDGTTWVPQPEAGEWWWSTPVWMAGADPTEGDSVYYFKSSEWRQVEGENIQTTTYEIGFTLPLKQNYLGGSYFMKNQFPLKHLTLETELRNAGYRLMKHVGPTHYSWEEEGVWKSGPEKPSDWDSIPVENKHEFAHHTFWLENTAVTGNNTATVDPESGDIHLNIHEENFYTWENDTERMVRTYVMGTTLADPVGFTFDYETLVNTVKTGIEAYFLSIPAIDLDTLKTEADAILIMPDTSTFPRIN